MEMINVLPANPTPAELSKIITLAEYGAAECIVGSKQVLSLFGHKIGQDIGMDYISAEKGLHYMNFPYDPAELTMMIISHGHADHMGALRRLVKAGFHNKIYSTKGTFEITMHQILQEKASVFWNNKDIRENPKKHGRFTSDSTSPDFSFKAGDYIYPFQQKITQEEIDAVKELFVGDAKGKGLPFKQKVKAASILDLTFFEAGHIPGSAQVLYEINTGKDVIKFLTCCDFGRTDHKVLQHPVDDIPLLKFPETDALPRDLDYILTEATYGNKAHRPFQESIDTLSKAIKDACEKKGALVIPAFSIHRTQIIKYMLFNLYKQGGLPKGFKIYVNSPSANDVEEVILDHLEDVDAKAVEDFKKRDNPFNFPNLVYVKEGKKYQDEFKRMLETEKGPYAVIAASGMCDQGRIVPILKRTIENPANIILLTGYCAPNTRGYLLSNAAEGTEIYFDAETTLKLGAEVRRMGGTSGHADGYELVEHLKCLHDPKKKDFFKGIFIKHGEYEACYGLQELILSAGYPKDTVQVMKKGERYILAA